MWILKKNFSKLANDGDWVYFQIVYPHCNFSHSFYIKLIKTNMEAGKTNMEASTEMSIIHIKDILPVEKLNDYKLHLGCWNGYTQPLDEFVLDFNNWKKWNEWKGTKDDFNRKFIFSVIDYYHEPDKWLFGGIWEVKKRHLEKSNEAGGYEIELVPEYQNLIGRLVLKYERKSGRGRAFKLENFYNDFTVSELLKERYTGESFCGYENINHDFTILESIYKIQKIDWKGALENIKGVYQIIDKSNGKKYVGSAYGQDGIWSRWACYMGTGHGWNDELITLINKKGIDYARQNFKFSLLEYRPMKTDDTVVIDRESYWKEVLLSRDFGYNKN